MIATGNAVAQRDARRQGGATVRTVVFERGGRAIGIAPQDNRVAQSAQGNRGLADKGRRADGVPAILDTGGQDIRDFDVGGSGGHGGFPSGVQSSPRRFSWAASIAAV